MNATEHKHAGNPFDTIYLILAREPSPTVRFVDSHAPCATIHTNMNSRDELQHKLGNLRTTASLARAVLENPRATEEQRERARLRLEATLMAVRRIEEELGIKRNEA